ncbi:hypothetical protein RJ640_021719 [Escallonia rubra]|uniref:Galactinol--sucrose galactosyltransferase n=1 Tax=Escallonia rubra TaxID=112253 RepID=A0AA88QS74_9ASTE|nr:hypothetical protein RJ640_021719 [Escallonia rubra]
MAPPNDPIFPIFTFYKGQLKENCFDLSDGKFYVNGVPLLSEVPSNITFKSFSSISQSSDAPSALFERVQSVSYKGGFLGFRKEETSDRLMNSLGKFSGRDFLSIFRFKIWWSTQWVGNSGSDLQMETQWVLFDVPEIKSYVLILPITEGSDDHVMICAESGSTQVKASSFDAIAYVHVSENPYNLMEAAFSAIRVHSNQFRLLEEKSVPPIVDKFGWCTWDAFYLAVETAGIWHGVQEFADAGLRLRFLIIDDGWQSVSLDGENPNEDAQNLVVGGTVLGTARLHRFDECDKFRNYKSGSLMCPNRPPYDPKKPKMVISKALELERVRFAIETGAEVSCQSQSEYEKMKRELNDLLSGKQKNASGESISSYSCEGESIGLKAFTEDLRTNFQGLDDIYVWQALCGSWGGVRPGTTHLNSKLISCKASPRLDGTMWDGAAVNLVNSGLGLVHPDHADDLYESMHSYLAEVGITGVKVDVTHSLEYVSEEYGGRVDLAKAYYRGLSKSLSKNFKGTGLISSMQQCNDFFLLGTQQISMGRVGDDFWFQDPYGDPYGAYWLQGAHMVHCANNSMWMGQTVQPDWDMFQSRHLCAKFHAGSRAICGGPVYVSDSLGSHDFDLLKKLVFHDGTIPKCQHFALPTRDCLFKNPLSDSKTYGGVVGAFNCQGAAWDPKEQRFRGQSQHYNPMSVFVHVGDIEWDQVEETVTMGEAEKYAVYLNQLEILVIATPDSEAIQITIQPSSFEIFSFRANKEAWTGY